MIKIWISLGQGQGSPHYYALTEASLKKYLDHLNKIGFNGFSYDEDKAQGFVQEFEICEKRLGKINQSGECYLWLESKLDGRSPSKVIALSDTMNNVATQVSKHWGKPVSKNHLLTQYMFTPKHLVKDVSGWDIKEFKQTYF